MSQTSGHQCLSQSYTPSDLCLQPSVVHLYPVHLPVSHMAGDRRFGSWIAFLNSNVSRFQVSTPRCHLPDHRTRTMANAEFYEGWRPVGLHAILVCASPRPMDPFGSLMVTRPVSRGTWAQHGPRKANHWLNKARRCARHGPGEATH
jgi:hypothetical protein